MLGLARWLVVLLALPLLGCRGFQVAPDDARRPDSDGVAEGRERGPTPGEAVGVRDRAGDRPRREATAPPGPCRAIPLPCLAAADPKVIEVPSEVTTLQAAFAAAKAGDTVQVRGQAVGPGWVIPAYVTLRGCEGATIIGNIRFGGSGGVVEGFEVRGAGQVVGNATGSYIVRYNRFVQGTLTAEAPLTARSVDGLVSADVTLIAESNWFAGATNGVEARTKYDTGVHTVALTVRNNIFTGVQRPLYAAEGGLVGKIKLLVEHNTLHDFKTAIGLWGVSDKPLLSGNLLQGGDVGVEGDALFEVQHCLTFQVKTNSLQPPLSGAFATGDPRLVDAAAGDLSLGPGSPAIDALPVGATVPSEDYNGCPRPVAVLGKEARADIGALEARP